MKRIFAFGIIVALLLNVGITLYLFSDLKSEIDQLQTKEPEQSTTQGPTEPPTETPQTESSPQETESPSTEPPTQDAMHELMAPEANLTTDVSYDRETYDHLDVNVEGFIINPNSLPVYNVSITLDFSLSWWRTATPLGCGIETRTISIGTLTGNEVVPINESFKFGYPDSGSSDFEGLSYTVNWDESE